MVQWGGVQGRCSPLLGDAVLTAPVDTPQTPARETFKLAHWIFSEMAPKKTWVLDWDRFEVTLMRNFGFVPPEVFPRPSMFPSTVNMGSAQAMPGVPHSKIPYCSGAFLSQR